MNLVKILSTKNSRLKGNMLDVPLCQFTDETHTKIKWISTKSSWLGVPKHTIYEKIKRSKI